MTSTDQPTPSLTPNTNTTIGAGNTSEEKVMFIAEGEAGWSERRFEKAMKMLKKETNKSLTGRQNDDVKSVFKGQLEQPARWEVPKQITDPNTIATILVRHEELYIERMADWRSSLQFIWQQAISMCSPTVMAHIEGSADYRKKEDDWEMDVPWLLARIKESCDGSGRKEQKQAKIIRLVDRLFTENRRMRA